MTDKINFSFGKNWRSFIKGYINEERIKKAESSLLDFLGKDNKIKGKTFVDVGCGSGLFSLAAIRLGAKRVVSFDVDPYSVECCKFLRERYAKTAQWQIEHGSILDQGFVSSLGGFDIVYSWGVLHHTGDMWPAIGNALRLVSAGGMFYIAIYNKAENFSVYPDGRFGTSGFWKTFKRFYAYAPYWVQTAIDYMVMAVLILGYLLTFKNPIRKIKEHIKLRGMSWKVDIRDWLGGYPYEYASIEEIFHFVKPKGFLLENLRSYNGLGNNEFLFIKS